MVADPDSQSATSSCSDLSFAYDTVDKKKYFFLNTLDLFDSLSCSLVDVGGEGEEGQLPVTPPVDTAVTLTRWGRN